MRASGEQSPELRPSAQPDPGRPLGPTRSFRTESRVVLDPRALPRRHLSSRPFLERAFQPDLKAAVRPVNLKTALMRTPATPRSRGASFWGPGRPLSPGPASRARTVPLGARRALWCPGELADLCVGVRQPLINIKPHHYLILVYSEIFLNRCHGKFIEKEHKLLQK